MTRIVKPELAQDLTDLFPVLEPRSLSPDEMSSTLQLTHDFLPGTHKMRLARLFASISSAAVANFTFVFPNDFFFPGYPVAPATGNFVPDGFYAYVGALDVFHNDTVNHNIQIQYVNSLVAVTVNLRDVQTGVGSGFPVSLPRPIMIPPTFGIRVVAEAALSAGKVFQFDAYLIPHKLLDPAPRF